MRSWPRSVLVSSLTLAFACACDGNLLGAEDAGPEGRDAPGLDAPGADAPEPDAPGLDAPRPDAPGLDAPGLDAPGLDAAAPDAYVAPPCDCFAPPPSTDFAACATGAATFHAALGGACMTHCDPTGACVYGTVELPCPPADALLPQVAPYQVALRTSMSRLTEADFEVTVAPITYDSALDDDALYHLWSGVVRAGGEIPSLPDYRGARLPSSAFLLDTFETGMGGLPHAYVGDGAPVNWALGFYATWDYAGNPYFGSRAMMRRAFFTSAADMMVMQTCSDARSCRAGASGRAVVRDNFAGAFREYAHIGYYAHRSGLIDACDLAAYDIGLRLVFDYWQSVNTSGSPNADMIMATLAGDAYVVAGIGDPALVAPAASDAEATMRSNCEDEGFCQHQGGTYDPSYEGYSAVHIAEAALVSGDPALVTWNARFAHLRALTTLPEPDGTFTGPSHFSPATSQSAANDQVSTYSRDVAVSQLSDDGVFFLHSAREPVPTVAEMRTQLSTGGSFAEANRFASDGSDPVSMPHWSYRHYPYENQPGFQHYRAGSFARFAAATGTDLALPPVMRVADFSESFENLLVSARAGSLATIVHVGPIDDGSPGAGFGGGALSALWSESTGAVILGWNRGAQSTEPRSRTVAACPDADCEGSCSGTTCTERFPNPFRWADLALWPTHAISGTRGARSFSSARVTEPTETVSLAGGVTTVTTTSELNGGTAEDADALAGSFTVSRTFTTDATMGGRLTIATTLRSTGNTADEIVETLPLFQGDRNGFPTTVQLRRMGGGMVAASTSNTTNVTAILVTRGTGTLEITLDAPRTVRLGPVSTNDYQWRPYGQNLVIQLHTGGSVAATTSFTTTFRILP